MQAAFTVRSGRDRVKITQLAAEPSGRPHESMSRKDSPPFGEALLRVTLSHDMGDFHALH